MRPCSCMLSLLLSKRIWALEKPKPNLNRNPQINLFEPPRPLNNSPRAFWDHSGPSRKKSQNWPRARPDPAQIPEFFGPCLASLLDSGPTDRQEMRFGAGWSRFHAIWSHGGPNQSQNHVFDRTWSLACLCKALCWTKTAVGSFGCGHNRCLVCSQGCRRRCLSSKQPMCFGVGDCSFFTLKNACPGKHDMPPSQF